MTTDQKSWKYTLLFAVILISAGFFLPEIMRIGWWAGYTVGLLTVVFHYIASHFTRKSSGRKFFRYYYAGLILRFFVVCGLFVFLLVMTKIDEFSFTVSFIISYLLNSINEVIFLNQKLSD